MEAFLVPVVPLQRLSILQRTPLRHTLICTASASPSTSRPVSRVVTLAPGITSVQICSHLFGALHQIIAKKTPRIHLQTIEDDTLSSARLVSIVDAISASFLQSPYLLQRERNQFLSSLYKRGAER